MTKTRRTPPARLRSRTIVAAALAALLALAASGCSLLIPPPPDYITTAVDRAVADIRSTEGIKTARPRLGRRGVRWVRSSEGSKVLLGVS